MVYINCLLKWDTNAGLLTDYVYNFENVEGVNTDHNYVTDAERAGALNNPLPGAAPGWSPAAPYGIRAIEVPLFPEYAVGVTTGSDVWLVDPKNLVWGVKREIQVYRQFVPRKDTIEYTMFTRVGCTIENPQAAVLVKNVAYRG